MDTNTVFNTTTNKTGLYRMPDVPVGPYSLTVTASGFKRSVPSGIVLEVDDKPEINFHLELGAVTETGVLQADRLEEVAGEIRKALKYIPASFGAVGAPPASR